MLESNLPIGVITCPPNTSLRKKQMLPPVGKYAISPFLKSVLIICIPVGIGGCYKKIVAVWLLEQDLTKLIDEFSTPKS